ncbi:hypothetical protein RJG79_03290 [Mycoplasmatota bacterium WC44]
MKIESIIVNELSATNFRNPNNIKQLRSKNGVNVYRIYLDDKSYVVKYFEKDEYKREIQMYKLLRDIGVKTLEIYESTNNLIVMEDIMISDRYRLGVEKDLSDLDVAKGLAVWYKDFHEKGLKYLKDNKDIKLYKELDYITIDTINTVKVKSYTESSFVWNSLISNIDIIKKKINMLPQTLNYNDFYYTNLIVSKDKKEAFMFDFNFMGQGLKYFDVRNVLYSLKGEAKQIFLEEYGEYDIKEKLVDDVMSVIYDLSKAYGKDIFPKWGEESLGKINDVSFEKNVSSMIDLLLEN